MKRRLIKWGILSLFLAVGTMIWGLAVDRAQARPQLHYDQGRVSVEAFQASVTDVLEALAESAGVDIFVSEDFEAQTISIILEEEALDDALKRILKSYNHAAIYTKKGEAWKLTAVKIYPKGRYGGEVVPLFSGRPALAVTYDRGETKTVEVISGKEMITYGRLQDQGVLRPSKSFPNVAPDQTGTRSERLLAFQRQMENLEAGKYETLMQIKRVLEAADDPDERKALSSRFAYEVETFHAMKKDHLNKMEDLKRLLN